MPIPNRACRLVQLDATDIPHLIWVDRAHGDYHVGTMRFADTDTAKRAAGLVEAAMAHYRVGDDYLREAALLQQSEDRQVFADRAGALGYFGSGGEPLSSWHANALLDTVDPPG
jgi:hypothetical protein